MKNTISLFSFVTVLSLFIISCESTSIEQISLKSTQNKNDISTNCSSIQSGEILYPIGHYLAGQSLSTGYDIFGYNYQAHMYKGNYANLYTGVIGLPPYEGQDELYLEEYPQAKDDNFFMTYYWPFRNDEVNMTWNDTWLSNKDCNGNDLLDNEQNTKGSGAWENYHSKGYYVNENNETCMWEQKFKIVAVPINAELVNDYWFDVDGNEIGKDFYGQFAIIQYVFNNPCGEENGVQYQSPFHVGLGNR